MEEDKLYCPHCGSSHLTANKKGFGVGKAAAGVLLTGGVGLLAGFIGSGKIKISCLKCGQIMNAGDLKSKPLFNRLGEDLQSQNAANRGYSQSPPPLKSIYTHPPSLPLTSTPYVYPSTTPPVSTKNRSKDAKGLAVSQAWLLVVIVLVVVCLVVTFT